MKRVDISYVTDKFNKYKGMNNDDNEGITNILNILNNDEGFITNLDKVESIIKNNESNNIDEVLYKSFLDILKYNEYIANKNIKETAPLLNKDIDFEEIEIKLADILSYLETDKDNIDKDLYSDLLNYSDINKLKDLSIYIKTNNDMIRVIYDKIEDKNILLSILLHSNREIIDNIYNIFKDNKANLNRVVMNIPSIFIKEKVSNKCKFNVLFNYDRFISNYELLKEYSIDFKKVLKWPIFFIKDVSNNKENIDKLIEFNAKPSNVLETVGGVFVSSPEIIFYNLGLLKFHNIKLDEEPSGYTILGMKDLDQKIDYLIEKDLWKNE